MPDRSESDAIDATSLPALRVLFAWELGGNLGHLARDVPLARLCRNASHQVVMAVPDLRTAKQVLADEQIPLVQAPGLRPASMKRRPSINYADMLLSEGHDDPLTLAGALAGWAGLIELMRPDCLLCDHAPTALLAARMTRVPALIVGSGFHIPPPHAVLPSFMPWQTISEARLRSVEDDWLARVNPVIVRAGAEPLARLSDLFPPASVLLATFAELDPFGPRPGCRYIGPVSALPIARETSWMTTAGVRVLAYLRPSVPRVEGVLEALEQLDAEVLCVMPGMPQPWQSRFRRLRCLEHPVQLGSAMQAADLVICYGSSTMAQALQVGRPVLVVPQVVEQYLSGLALERAGAGLMLQADRSAPTCKAALLELLGNARYRNAAQDLAQRYASFDVDRAAHEQYTALTALCERAPV